MAEVESLFVKMEVDFSDVIASADKAKRAISDFGNTVDKSAGAATESVQEFGDETEKAGNRGTSALSKLIPSWKEVAIAATAAMAALGSVGLKVIQTAADADATTQKFNTVFKEYAAGTQQWADQYSSAAGRSRVDVMAWAASVQDTLVPMGYSREEAAKMSEQLVQVGVDLGAFYDEADSDVMEKITSGLVGNTENWRGWGVVASENAIKQELINMLGEEGAKTATESQKVQARLNILLKGTADAQGQAAREADSYQSQLKKLAGQINDVMAEAGKGAMENMAGVLKRVTDMMNNGGSDRLVTVFKSLADAVAWTVDTVFDAIDAFKQWGNSGAFDAIREFASVALNNLKQQIGGAIQAVQNFAGNGGFQRLGEAVTNVIHIMTKVNQTLSDLGIYRRLGEVIGGAVKAFLWLVDAISSVVNWASNLYRSFSTAYQQMASGAQGIRTTVGGAFQGLQNIVTTAINTIRNIVTTGWNAIRTAITTSTNAIWSAVTSAWNNIRNTVASAINGISSNVSNGWRGILSTVLSIAGSIYTGVTSRFNSILSAIQNIVERIKSVFSTGLGGLAVTAGTAMSKVVGTITGYGGSLYSAGASAGQQAVNGLASKVSSMQSLYNQYQNFTKGLQVMQDLNNRSSGSSGSTGIRRQGSEGTGESRVRIVEAHATGGMAGYTGMHWMEKGEIAIPKQYDWNKHVIDPIVSSVSNKPNAPTMKTAPVMRITINNTAADINTTAKTLAKLTSANVRAMMV